MKDLFQKYMVFEKIKMLNGILVMSFQSVNK
jgi:hypothetical protein